MPFAQPLRTQRLALEPLTVHHADEMAEVLDDDRLHLHIGGAPATLPELRTRYARLAAGPAPFHQELWLNWIMRRRRDGQAIGYVQATVAPGRRASVAWVTGMPYQGFGFATEAARAVVAHLRAHGIIWVVAGIHPENAASAAVARKLGLDPTDERDGDDIVWSAQSARFTEPGKSGG